MAGPCFVYVVAADLPNADVVEKPTTIGLCTPRRPNVIEKPITLDGAMATGPIVIEKPITLDPREDA